MHPFSITLWLFVYNICVNFYFQKFWLIHICYHIIGNMTCGSRIFDSYGFIRCSPFWFLNLLEYIPKQFLPLFSLFALAANNYIHVSKLASYLLAIRQEGWFFFFFFFFFLLQTKRSSFLQILSFIFFLVTSECNVYLPVDPSLVYSYPKMLLLFFSLILAWFKTIFLDSYLSVFCSSIKFEFCHLLLLACKSCFSNLMHFNFKINTKPYQSNNYMPLLVFQY